MSPLAPTSPNPLHGLFARDVLEDAKATLSSWDSCMAQPYCKWPVIVAIIIASAIVLSVVVCIVRCACCGLECCCWCCSCCNACCPSPRKKAKYAQAPQHPPQYPQPYGYQPAMGYGPPQFATYDVSGRGKVTEDSLPAMPSWETAQTRHVEDPAYMSGAIGKDASGKEGIALGAMGAGAHANKDLYEDPDERYQRHSHDSDHDNHELDTQPMLSASQHPYGHQNNYQGQGYGHNGGAASVYSYNDGNTSYAPSELSGYHTQRSWNNPKHPYDSYNQQQDGYSTYEQAQSPSSVYTPSTTLPAYTSRAASVRTNTGPTSYPSQGTHPRLPQVEEYNAPEAYDYSTHARLQTPKLEQQQYQPSTGLPGALMPGGPQRFYGQ